jgi:hypothetical protein
MLSPFTFSTTSVQHHGYHSHQLQWQKYTPVLADLPAFSAACCAVQVALLKELRPEKLAGTLEISTVDGFQGREKEAIVISMVRR